MDYDDNDFQSQNIHLAGESSNKFPTVLQPYVLPKFDFDDSLHVPLRFDSLVEAQAFLGIEGNEDNQWIEEFSRGGSGIQFSSSAAESCPISRCNNVWSEATSSESVELLLKAVGQEEIVPVQTNIRESDACDELGCIIKHMEPSLKQDNNTPSKVGDIKDLYPTLLPDEVPENLSALDNDGRGQQSSIKDISHSQRDDISISGGSGDVPAISEGVQLPNMEVSSFVDGECNNANQMEGDTVLGGSTDSKTQKEKVSPPHTQVDTVVQCIVTGNDNLNNAGSPNNVNDTINGTKDLLETENGENCEQQHILSQEAQRDDQNLSANVIDSGTPDLQNPLCLASSESMEVANKIDANMRDMAEHSCIMVKGDSGSSEALEIGDFSESHEVSLMAVEDKVTLQKHEVGDSDSSQVDNKKSMIMPGSSLLSARDIEASIDKVDGSSDDNVHGNSNLSVVHSSTEILCETQTDGQVSSSMPVVCTQLCNKNEETQQGDINKGDQEVSPIEKCAQLPSDGSNTQSRDIVVPAIDGGPGPLSFGGGGTENELLVSKSKSDFTSGNESVDNVPVSSLDCTSTIEVLDQKEVEASPVSVVGFTHSDEGVLSADKNSVEASLSDLKTSQVTTGIDHVSELEKGSSSSTGGHMLCQKTDPSLSAVDLCSHSEPQAAAINRVSQEYTKETQVCPVLCDSDENKGDGAEALTEERDGKASSKSSESIFNNNEELAKDKSWQDISPKVPEKGTVSVSIDTSAGQIHVPTTDECGGSADVDKPGSGSPTIIRCAELSQNEINEEGCKGSTDQTVSVSETSHGNASKVWSFSNDPKQSDTSKDERSFTFEVSPLADSQKVAGEKWQPFPDMQPNKLSLSADGSPSTPSLGQLDPKIAEDVSRGNLKVSEAVVVRSGSKANPERKTRRPSNRSIGKDSAKKGSSIKGTGSSRLERVGPHGVSQLVPSNEMQHYGLVDSSSMKSFVLAASASSLPDLNSSASPSGVFQQPFTDLQQVQLRAQIFVYGALIQGTAPDEAYMISAFGGLDGGRSIWENAWRTCIERIHVQKSHLVTPEIPLQSRSGARTPDQAIKQSVIQGKAISSPVGQASSKGTPTTIVNPLVPLSSPLWTLPTPSGDSLQSTGIPRGPVMDYQRGLSPLHPHQTPSIRNFVGHSPSWISQAPFCGPWVASPQTSTLDVSGRFSGQLPIIEPVHLPPIKESSIPQSSAAKHVSPGPVAHGGASASILTGSAIPDVRKVAASGQLSADPKPRKRKKTSVSESPSQDVLPQPQTESVPAPAVTGYVPAPVAITAPTEKFTVPVSSTFSIDLRTGDWNADQRAILSEETLGKVKEARVQAEGAAVLAAAAVSHGQEIWNQLDKQRNSGLPPDVESKLASAAVAIAAAAAVAKAAAAAANVASNAALQAKLMAVEVGNYGGYNNHGQSNIISVSDGTKNLGQASPASILKADDGSNSSSSILVAAREAARRRVEAASAASKRAENMDAIVKAAELAAEAVSQAGKIVAMGDPLPFSELIAAGRVGYCKVAAVTSELISKANDFSREKLVMDGIGEAPDTSARHLKGGPSDHNETQNSNHGNLTTQREMPTEGHLRLADGYSGSNATCVKDAKGQNSHKASDSAKTIGVVLETENGSRSSITVQNEYQKAAETSIENGIREGSLVEVFKDGNGFKAAWFSANVLSLKDGKAYVSYTELTVGEGIEKLKEWVPLKGEGEGAPKIRAARPITAMPFEGTRKRRRAAMGDYAWFVGDKVDAWIQDGWREGVITEKCKKDETLLTVHFLVQGETSVVRAWHLRPSLVWKNGEWIECSSSREDNSSAHGGDMPQEKRPRVRSPAIDVKGKDKKSKSIDAIEPDKPNEPTLLDLSANVKMFNVGKGTRDQNKSDTLRMTRTGLQREGSRVTFGAPRPGKKRKFMEVSKHYVANRNSKINESNDSAKFGKYPTPQGFGSRGWKNTSKIESNEKQAALLKPKVVKPGKPQNGSGRTVARKDNQLITGVSTPDDGAIADHIAKTKDSVSHVENASGKSIMEFQHFSTSEGAAGEPIIFSSLALPSDGLSSKKMSASNAKPERLSKGKLAPAGGRLGKIENKVFNGSSAKSTSDAVEPRRSNRRIQPTSRLLEGLQSSLMVSKTPSVSHDKFQKSRSASRGNV